MRHTRPVPFNAIMIDCNIVKRQDTMTVVKVSPKYQVVIPQKIRESLGIEPGQRVQALQYMDRIEFIPVKPAKAMRGFLKGIDTSVPRDGDRI